MKIRAFYRLENGVYRVSINTEEWSENDIRLMEKFGEPEIDIGGTLTYEDEGSDPVSLVLEEEYRRIKSEPIFASFDSRDSSYAKRFANLWADEIIGKISAAYSSLHAHVDDFTRETVHTLSSF